MGNKKARKPTQFPAMPTRRWRKCLGYCGKRFRSEGPHNRICGRCRAKQYEHDWMEQARMNARGIRVIRKEPQ